MAVGSQIDPLDNGYIFSGSWNTHPDSHPIGLQTSTSTNSFKIVYKNRIEIFVGWGSEKNQRKWFLIVFAASMVQI